MKEMTVLRLQYVVFATYIDTERIIQQNMPEQHISLLSDLTMWALLANDQFFPSDEQTTSITFLIL